MKDKEMIEEMAKENQYKPPLGKKVYCIYDDECILVEEVGYLGKDSFIIADFDECNNFDSFEWYYEDYNETWFTNLEKAKKKLLEVAYREDNEKLKVVKLYDNYYGLREI